MGKIGNINGFCKKKLLENGSIWKLLYFMFCKFISIYFPNFQFLTPMLHFVLSELSIYLKENSFIFFHKHAFENIYSTKFIITT